MLYGYSRIRIKKLWEIFYDTLYNPWTKYEEVEIVFTKDRDTELGHTNVLSTI